MKRLPLPDGVVPNIIERLVYMLPSSMQNNAFLFVDFVINNQAWILLIFILFVLSFLFFRLIKQKQSQIEKIWHMVKFFLKKRHGLLPLIYTLGKQEGVLEEKKQKEFLKIYKELREENKLSPSVQIKKEKRLSRILYDFFLTVESLKDVKRKKLFENLVQEFEYLDEKLIQIQKLYNLRILKWNKKRNFILIRPFVLLFKFPKFELFGDKK